VVTVVAGLAGLEVQPVRILVGVAARVGTVVDAGGLRVRVPGLHFDPAGFHLRFEPGSVAADEIYRLPSTVARNKIAAEAGVLLGRDHRPTNALALPSVAMEHGLQHGGDAVIEQHVADLVEVSEVVDVDVIQLPG
jgi:hypothetical protein